MAGKPKDYGPDVAARIATLTDQGWPAKRIALDPKVAAAGVSERSISRKQRGRRGAVSSRAASKPPAGPPKGKSAPVVPDVPTSPEDIPSDASLPELADLLRRAKLLLKAAEEDKNLPLAGQMIRVCSQLAETIRKATPPTPEDPNDSPDMVAKGKETRERLHKAVDLVIKGVV